MSMQRTTSGAGGTTSHVRDRLRATLPAAIKTRDTVAISALRSALAAIENAEAVADVPRVGVGTSPIAGAVVGLGAGEAERLLLSEAEIEDLVRAEAAERQSAARAYEGAGHHDRAVRLRAEAAVLLS